MNPNCKKEIQNCNSINEIIAVVNKYYDLDKNFGPMTAAFVKDKFIKDFSSNIQKLDIQERPIDGTKKGILSF